MKTQYAAGRSSFSAPSLTATSGGNIAAGTYYFWIKARNRVGYNAASAMTTITFTNNQKLVINSSNFIQFDYEDWHEFIILCSSTNNINDSKVIAKYDVTTTLANIEIIENYVISSNGIYATPSALPTINVPFGYRAAVTSVSKVYEYNPSSPIEDDGINRIGNWVNVYSNSLTELLNTANKELSDVIPEELLSVPLDNNYSIKYWIINDTSEALEKGNLFLNAYSSNPLIEVNYYVKTIGYVNTTNFVFDTSSIDDVGVDVLYKKATDVSISKPLPANSAYVLEISPQYIPTALLTEGNYITLYPVLARYELVEGNEYWANPVATLTALQELNEGQLIHGQVRLVQSINKTYIYDAFSTATANGDTVVSPNSNPTSGRWLKESVSLSVNSVGIENLQQEVIDLITQDTSAITRTISVVGNYVIDLDADAFAYDYYIINTPTADLLNTETVINVTGTISSNNSVLGIVIELRQNTGILSFHESFIFPGGIEPLLSGNGKTDLLLVKFVRDSSGNIKKRLILLQRDIG